MRTTISALAAGTLSITLATPAAGVPDAPAGRFPYEKSWRLARVVDGGEVVRLRTPDIAVLSVYPPSVGGGARYSANVCQEYTGSAAVSDDGTLGMTRGTVWKESCSPKLRAAATAFRKLLGADGATWRVVDGRIVLKARGVKLAFVPYDGPRRMAGDKIVVHRRAGTAERYLIVVDGDSLPAASVDWWYRLARSA